jgi:SYP7 family syntaxin
MTTVGELHGLMSKLYTIHEECGGDKQMDNMRREDDPDIDDFTRLRRRIAREVKDIRSAIQEREELLGKTGTNTVQTVEASANIRSRIKTVKDNVEQLQRMQQTEETKIKKKAGKKPLEPQQEENISQKAEVVSLAFKHIEECEILEKGRYSTAYQRSTFAPQTSGAIITSLPDIDDGDFQQLRLTDRKIDTELDEISSGVGQLKEIALAMGKEVKKQEIMMDTIERRVDNATTQLQSLNKRLRDTIEKVRKGDKFIIDFILLCVLLAIVGYIYQLVA